MKLTEQEKLDTDSRVRELEEAIKDYWRIVQGTRRGRRIAILRILRSRARNLAYKLHILEKKSQ